MIAPPFYEIKNGVVRINLHRGQQKVMASTKDIVLALGGTQSGKSELGPFWLANEIQQRGPGDYLVAGPNIPLLSKKVIPAFLKLFRRQLRWGSMTGRTPHFQFSTYAEKQLWGRAQHEDTKVFFGHGSDPDSLESATAKAVWLDEAGQKKFKLGSWEAVLRRVAVKEGRILITTTPYALNWLYTEIYKRWKQGDKRIDVIEFESIANPAFSRKRWDDAKATLPRWKFDLFYRARFTKPAGAIYDCFDEDRHTCPPFMIPEAWPRYIGLDFGGVNTAAVFLAAERKWDEDLDDWGDETGRYFLYRDYHEGGKTASEHAKALYLGEPRMPKCVGGSSSEGQWRKEFAAGGLVVMDPALGDKETPNAEGRVEVGINRVYGLLKLDDLVVFNDRRQLIEDITNYSRELDDSTNEPTEKIEDKDTWHRLDALRYICFYLKRRKKQAALA